MDQVTAAFDATPRRDFLPRGVRRRASYDGPLEIAAGQTNSQPRTVDDMLRLLDVRAGQRVLDVGSGSGWTTALLAHLVGPAGSVLGVELEPELVSFGTGNLARTDRPASRTGRLAAASSGPRTRSSRSAAPITRSTTTWVRYVEGSSGGHTASVRITTCSE